jgi:hypothetical protein
MDGHLYNAACPCGHYGCSFIQSKYKQQFTSRLATFDQNLKMDTSAEFETSLDNLKQIIEVAAIMVGKRGWSESDIEWFYKEAQKTRQNIFRDDG